MRSRRCFGAAAIQGVGGRAGPILPHLSALLSMQTLGPAREAVQRARGWQMTDRPDRSRLERERRNQPAMGIGAPVEAPPPDLPGPPAMAGPGPIHGPVPPRAEPSAPSSGVGAPAFARPPQPPSPSPRPGEPPTMPGLPTGAPVAHAEPSSGFRGPVGEVAPGAREPRDADPGQSAEMATVYPGRGREALERGSTSPTASTAEEAVVPGGIPGPVGEVAPGSREPWDPEETDGGPSPSIDLAGDSGTEEEAGSPSDSKGLSPAVAALLGGAPSASSPASPIFAGSPAAGAAPSSPDAANLIAGGLGAAQAPGGGSQAEQRIEARQQEMRSTLAAGSSLPAFASSGMTGQPAAASGLPTPDQMGPALPQSWPSGVTSLSQMKPADTPEVRALIEQGAAAMASPSLKRELEIEKQLRAQGLSPTDANWGSMKRDAIARDTYQRQALQEAQRAAHQARNLPTIVFRHADLTGEQAWKRYFEAQGIRQGTPNYEAAKKSMQGLIAANQQAFKEYHELKQSLAGPLRTTAAGLTGEEAWKRYLLGLGIRPNTVTYDEFKESMQGVIAEDQRKFKKIWDARQAGLLPQAVTKPMPTLVWVFPEDPAGPTEHWRRRSYERHLRKQAEKRGVITPFPAPVSGDVIASKKEEEKKEAPAKNENLVQGIGKAGKIIKDIEVRADFDGRMSRSGSGPNAHHYAHWFKYRGKKGIPMRSKKTGKLVAMRQWIRLRIKLKPKADFLPKVAYIVDDWDDREPLLNRFDMSDNPLRTPTTNPRGFMWENVEPYKGDRVGVSEGYLEAAFNHTGGEVPLHVEFLYEFLTMEVFREKKKKPLQTISYLFWWLLLDFLELKPEEGKKVNQKIYRHKSGFGAPPSKILQNFKIKETLLKKASTKTGGPPKDSYIVDEDAIIEPPI